MQICLAGWKLVTFENSLSIYGKKENSLEKYLGSLKKLSYTQENS